MRVVLLCVCAAVFAAAQVESVVKHEVAAEDRAERAAALRAILDKGTTVEDDAEGLVVHSNGTSAAIAELLLQKLDARQFGEFAVPDAADEKLAILSAPVATLPISRVIQVVCNLQLAAPLAKAQAIVVRGRQERIVLAEWLLPRLSHLADASAEQRTTITERGRTHEVRVFSPTGKVPAEEIQRVLASLADTPSVLLHQSPEAMVMRGEPSRVALGAWLFQQLDNPPSGIQATVPMYHLEGVDDPLVRIFYTQEKKSPDDLRTLATAVRSASRVLRLQIVPATSAIVLRGSTGQIVLAERVVNDNIPPTFEVASVKSSARDAMPRISSRADGIDSQDQNLRSYIARAYGLSSYQIIGPAWLDTERFDITAKAASAVSEQQRRAMLQSLLAERFHLTTHRETQSLNGYALMVARGGVKVQPVERSATPPPTRAVSNRMMSLKENSFRELAQRLEWILNCPVEDATHVDGVYSFDLRWTPDAIQAGTRGLAVPISDAASGPSLFEVLDDKVGVKLEKRKIPTEVLVVDHLDRAPDGN